MFEYGFIWCIVYYWFVEYGVRLNVYVLVGGNEVIVSMVVLECGIGFVFKVVFDYLSMVSFVI